MKINIKNPFNGDKYIPKKISYPFLILWALVILVFSIDTGIKIADSKKVQSSQPEVERVQMVTYQEPSVLPTTTSTPLPTPSVTTYDPDPVIDCIFTNIPSRQMKKSACLKSTECEINGKWVFYADRNQCIKDQNAAQPAKQNTITKKEVEQMIAKNQVESANRQLQNDKYNNCMSQTQTESLSCMAECSKKDQEYTNACDAAYFNGDNYNSEMYQACNAQRRTETSACNDKCFEVTKKCQY